MIGRQIHSCWIGAPLPDDIRKRIDHGKALNEKSGWTYTFHQKEVLDRYADDPYIRVLLQRRDQIAYVVDRIRLLLIRDFGGFWVDSDAVWVRPMSLLNAVCDRPDVDFISALRNPWRPNIGVAIGIPLVDNTVMGSAKDGEMVGRLLRRYTPEDPKQTGHTVGMEIMRTCDQNTVLLNYRFFYSLTDQMSPETIFLHDGPGVNLGSWSQPPPIAT